MKVPGPDHPISIAPHQGRVVVTYEGTVVADTRRALALREASYPAVYYVPRADARLEHYRRSEHRTHCPYKGDAAYFHLVVGARRADDAVWSYETPYPAVAEIAGRVAFYPNKVTIRTE